MVPSIDFRNTSRFARCTAVSPSAMVVGGPNAGPNPCSGKTASRVWAWPRCRYGA